MERLLDDYYYRLGRHMAVIERNNNVITTQLDGITLLQRRDLMQGYNDMVAMFDWRREPIREDGSS